jgi:hypothetical protein
MIKLEDTLGICEHCYRHVPAIRFLRNGSIYIGKTCPVHGYVEHLVEPDADFYTSYEYTRRALESYFLEITNHCNLACPHCYQEPDNTTADPSIDYILSLIDSWPDDGYSVALVGAEPTTRKDLPDLIRAINNMNKKHRNVMILTNGVYLSNYEYAKRFTEFDYLQWTVGLNHPEYQGHTVRRKQMEGIKNCTDLKLPIKNVSYTLETVDQLEYCLDEIQEFGDSICSQYRIRCGADIGRYPGGPKIYMSQLVNEVKSISRAKGWSFSHNNGAGNRSHYAAIINNLPIKIIQWPDVRTIDLGEVQTEAIADILPGKPPSPLVHQVILRDAMINKKMMLYLSETIRL